MLASMGYATVEESARAIIAERLAAGLSRRPSPSEFAHQILSRDTEKYVAQRHTSNWVFFDRSLIDALGMLQKVSPIPDEALAAMLTRYPFYRSVFILPPWEAIYATDAERDQTYAEAGAVYQELRRWYRLCGYDLQEVPCLPGAQRARHVLRALAVSGAGRSEPVT